MYSIEELKCMYPDVSLDIWHMIDNFDAYTFNHSIRMCEMGREVEQALGLKNHDLSEACLLHDIGKFFISWNILGKRSNLTTLEREFMDGHAWFSYLILSHCNIRKSVCQIALYHHKTKPVFFGKTLPECKDEEILRMARIIKTIDIFEAMGTDRPYHRGVNNKEIQKEFEHIEHDEETLKFLLGCEEFAR